ncbi:MAG: PAS domain S-box protein [Phycisphaera sp.]|nr:PAS domain S-box protein [Phycisphaera sp.]
MTDPALSTEPLSLRAREAMTRGHAIRAVVTLSLLGALAIAEYMIYQHQTDVFQRDVLLIEYSEKQRHAFDDIGHRVREMSLADTPERRRAARERLAESVDEFERVHNALMHGDPGVGVPRPVDSVERVFEEDPYRLCARAKPFIASVHAVAETPPEVTIDLRVDPARSVLDAVDDSDILLGIDAVTDAYKGHFRNTLATLDLIWRSVLGATLMSLVAAWIVAFRPMFQRSRRETLRLYNVNAELNRRAVELEQTLADLEASRSELSDRSLAMLSILEDLEGERKKLAAEIVERQRAERELRASEERFRDLAETVRLIPWECNADDLRFSYVGPQAEHILGYPVDDWLEPGFWADHIHADARAYDLARLGEMIRKHDHFEIEMRMIAADGRVVWLYNVVRVVRDGETTTLRGVMVDITARREAERQVYHERERLDRMVDTADVAIAFRDSAGRILRVNDAFVALTGYSREELCSGRISWKDLTAPEYRERYEEAMERLGRTGRFEAYEKEYIRKDGVRVPILISAAKLLDEEDEHVAFIVDLTERKLAEQRLIASEERTRLIVDTALDAVVTMDSDGRVTGWNPQAEQVFGWTREEAVGERLASLIIPDQYHDAHQRGLKRFLQDGRGNVLNRRIELSALRRDGKRFPVELAIVPIHLRDTWEFCGFLRDISERIEFEQSLKAANAELEQTNQEMEQFVYTASHDLKSPIVTMLGFLGLMRQDIGANRHDRMREFIEQIERAGNKMRRCIDELLELSRIGRVPNNPESVALSELVAHVVSGHQSAIGQRGVEVDVAPDMPMIRADRNRLTHLFENLIVNALKYGCDADTPRISIGCEHVDNEVRIFVRDNGKGIRAEYHDRVFEMFQRLDNSIDGTGMGLAIVRRITEMHGGRTWVESVERGGATFWVGLPDSLVVGETTADR